MYEQIEYEVTENIATVFLNRPAKKNAYTPHMGMEIVAAMEAAMTDSDVRVIILTGRGDAFCGGVDLEFLRAHMAGEDTGPVVHTEANVVARLDVAHRRELSLSKTTRTRHITSSAALLGSRNVDEIRNDAHGRRQITRSASGEKTRS